MVRLEIVEPSSGPLFKCFNRKWSAMKLSNPQVAHFSNVSLANGTPWNCRTLKWPTFSIFPSQMVCLKIVKHSSGPLFPCFSRKLYTLKLSNSQVVNTFSMFASQMVRLEIVEPWSGPLFPCFSRKWNTLKLSNPQVAHFFHVSLANGTPWNCQTLKCPTFSMFASQMVRLEIVEPSRGPLFPCLNRKWYALKLSNPQEAHFFHLSLANGTP